MNYREMEHIDLFHGLNSAEIERICDCFGTQILDYEKGTIIVREGERQKQFGVVLAGEARSFKTDISGKIFTVAIIREGGYIGALLAGIGTKPSPVTVSATDRLTVLFFPFGKLTRQCKNNCAAHAKILSNFISGVSEKAMHLFERIDCITKPTIREKVMAYLTGQPNADSGVFEIPFDREGMAEYLNTERSALSRELSNMKKDGLIDYYRNSFRIL